MFCLLFYLSTVFYPLKHQVRYFFKIKTMWNLNNYYLHIQAQSSLAIRRFPPPFTFAIGKPLLYELRWAPVDSQTGRTSGFPTANGVCEEAPRFLWPYLGQHRRCVRPEEHFPGPKMICCLPSMTRKISESRQRRSWLHHAGLRGGGGNTKPAHTREIGFTGGVTHAADD